MKAFVVLCSVVLLSMSACATAPRGASGAQSPKVAASLPKEAPNRRSIVRKILQHNVRVVISDGGEPKRTASGVVVGSEATAGGAYSFVMTNAHVLDPSGLKSPTITVLIDSEGHDDAVEYAAEPTIVGAVPEMDLALLRVRGASLVPASLAQDSELEPGEDVLVVAAPYGKAVSLSGGMISQVEWDRRTQTPRILKTDAPIGYGASGGGIYSRETGHLLAIVEGYRTAKVGFAVAEQSYSFDVPMPGETFGAPSAKVRAFLTQHGYTRFLLPSTPPAVDAEAAASR
jgi:serine protease Do